MYWCWYGSAFASSDLYWTGFLFDRDPSRVTDEGEQIAFEFAARSTGCLDAPHD